MLAPHNPSRRSTSRVAGPSDLWVFWNCKKHDGLSRVLDLSVGGLCVSIEKSERIAVGPDLNGIEVASVLKRAVPDIKLILFTMKVDGLGKSLASAIGIDFVLSKEESINKLVEHLKNLIPVSAAAAAPTANT